MPEHHFIYRLADPRNGLVKYIGCCTNPYWTEFRHRSVVANKTQPKLKAWIRELRDAGLRPQFKLLQKVLHDQSHRIETHYIRSFNESVPGQLLNVAQTRTTAESILRTKFKNRRAIDAKRHAESVA